MRESKSSSGSRGKRKHSPVPVKKKRTTPISRSVEKGRKKKNDEKLPRKTRWETSNTKNETDKKTPTSREDESSNPEFPRRLKDMLGDKKKIVEYLFLTVTVTTLEELIPDYLKNRSIEELKKLCYAEIKEMSEENILEAASGFSNSEKTESADGKPVVVKGVETREDIDSQTATFKSSSKHSSPGVSETFSADLLELCASPSEVKDLSDDNEPASVSEDLEKEEYLPVIDNDADLVELEMRARAIRSLLKAKNQVMSDSDD